MPHRQRTADAFRRGSTGRAVSDIEAELRSQLQDAFADADYPVEDPPDLLPALPDGPMTTFQAGDIRLTAMELATEIGDEAAFPYGTLDELVDDVIAALRSNGTLD
jgi:hypothetical protein